MKKLAILLVLVTPGCVRHDAILIRPGQAVQLAEDTPARVYTVVNGVKVKSDNKVTIPAGWVALPVPAPAPTTLPIVIHH